MKIFNLIYINLSIKLLPNRFQQFYAIDRPELYWWFMIAHQIIEYACMLLFIKYRVSQYIKTLILKVFYVNCGLIEIDMTCYNDYERRMKFIVNSKRW